MFAQAGSQSVSIARGWAGEGAGDYRANTMNEKRDLERQAALRERRLVALADRVMIMHQGQKIYEGSAAGLAGDKTVVEVYLGEGVAKRLHHYLDGKPADG